jgi:inositol transport system ATP-binding protein
MNDLIKIDQSGFCLQMEGISKSFTGVSALNNVNLFIKQGEVHALMGENGAGKSTLMKILIGIHQKDNGKITFQGKEILFNNPKVALSSGIVMIHQELNPIPEMTIAENIFLGREPVYKGLNVVNGKKLRQTTSELLKQMDLSLDSDTKMKDLSISEMQMVEIVKALSYDARLIIMDEPTSAISDKEVEKLFEKISKLKAKNISIIYISHKMEEIYKIADSITILRDGEYIDTCSAKTLLYNDLIKKMVGRDLKEVFPKENINIKEVVFEVKNFNKTGVFSAINFCLRKGEILGIAGLMGAGRTELTETIFGIERPDSGKLFLNGQEIEIHNPGDAINNGIGLIPEDRKIKGLNLCWSVMENISLAYLDKFCSFGGIINLGKEKKEAVQQVRSLNIRTPSVRQQVERLSGGNQQKVVLSKWLIGNAAILIFDEPTRGIDIGSKSEIYKIMIDFVKQGKSIIMVSSELPELIGMCNRILVLHKGKITGEFEREHFNQERILKAAMGEKIIK